MVTILPEIKGSVGVSRSSGISDSLTMTNMTTSRPFFWWDDAVAFARLVAADTGHRHSVKAGPLGYWYVEPV